MLCNFCNKIDPLTPEWKWRQEENKWLCQACVGAEDKKAEKEQDAKGTIQRDPI